MPNDAKSTPPSPTEWAKNSPVPTRSTGRVVPRGASAQSPLGAAGTSLVATIGPFFVGSVFLAYRHVSGSLGFAPLDALDVHNEHVLEAVGSLVLSVPLLASVSAFAASAVVAVGVFVFRSAGQPP